LNCSTSVLEPPLAFAFPAATLSAMLLVCLGQHDSVGRQTRLCARASIALRRAHKAPVARASQVAVMLSFPLNVAEVHQMLRGACTIAGAEAASNPRREHAGGDRMRQNAGLLANDPVVSAKLGPRRLRPRPCACALSLISARWSETDRRI
jgi:hypothetical protein